MLTTSFIVALHRGHAIRRLLFKRSDIGGYTDNLVSCTPIGQPVELRRVLRRHKKNMQTG